VRKTSEVLRLGGREVGLAQAPDREDDDLQ
jgi:hypothetical protein